MKYPQGGLEKEFPQSAKNAAKEAAKRECKSKANAMCPRGCECSDINPVCDENLKVMTPADAQAEYGNDAYWDPVIPNEPDAPGFVLVLTYGCKGSKVTCSKQK